jgi:hypothetical protein
MCRFRGLRGIFGGRGEGQKGLWGIGQLILSMGLMWKKVRILGQRTTTPSKGFFVLITTPVLIFVVYAVNMFFCAIHIFLLYRLKINHMTEI